MKENVSGVAARIALVALVSVALVSCATAKGTYKENPKAVLGSVIGAAAGAGLAAALGADAGGIVAAGVGGAVVGGVIGHKLDDRDKRMAAQAAQQAFESNQTGQSSDWRNPDSGNSGTVTPTRTYQIANGQYCREYRQDIMVGNEKHQTHGTACRQPDGAWEIQG